ncbi:hypothetical protein ASD67_08490 [Sphingopyxis sp. Root1497]|uniref:hypothetical protein n=1 Tax=Sphingopyxis sp. Root1497 TaxID=1736474 RepID=UPI0007127E11|nr:hypothetical protein [Sphingopyxis sp. Root1497]KQZ64496.1 hypothetical protein ASD67_08490 [Sphingopyxis sp. Root1497]
MDRAERPVRRWPWIAAAVLLGLVAAVWAVLPDGKAARVERHAACGDLAGLPRVERLADGRSAMRLRVLQWNVEGLPWPIRSGRKEKLAHIADWIAKRRAAGLGPDILILHKAFTPEASRIAVAAGFRTILPGPARDQRRELAAAPPPAGYADAARWWKGEHVGKWLDGGLYVATDLPAMGVVSTAFGRDSCAGYDCLSNKGAQFLALPLPGAPEPLAIFNTHRNSREPAKVGIARAETAHMLQTKENDAFLTGFAASDTAMIAAGDFNNYRAGDRSGRFAADPAFRLVGKGAGFAARPAPMTDHAAWKQAYDLIGYRSNDRLRVEPLSVATLFDGKHGPRLSDHDAQYIVFRISWRSDAQPLAPPPCFKGK